MFTITFLLQVSGLVFTKAQIKLVAYGMKHVLAVHSFRNLKKAERQAGEDFDMEEENNRKKQLEDILHQVCFPIFFSLYLIG
jgi:hypothetical protein